MSNRDTYIIIKAWLIISEVEKIKELPEYIKAMIKTWKAMQASADNETTTPENYFTD